MGEEYSIKISTFLNTEEKEINLDYIKMLLSKYGHETVDAIYQQVKKEIIKYTEIGEPAEPDTLIDLLEQNQKRALTAQLVCEIAHNLEQEILYAITLDYGFAWFIFSKIRKNVSQHLAHSKVKHESDIPLLVLKMKLPIIVEYHLRNIESFEYTERYQEIFDEYMMKYVVTFYSEKVCFLLMMTLARKIIDERKSYTISIMETWFEEMYNAAKSHYKKEFTLTHM